MSDERAIYESMRTEVLRLRETNARLNRRCQAAESAARDTLERARRSDGSIGRTLANWAASQYRRELDEARAEIERLRALLDEQATKGGG